MFSVEGKRGPLSVTSSYHAATLPNPSSPPLLRRSTSGPRPPADRQAGVSFVSIAASDARAVTPMVLLLPEGVARRFFGRDRGASHRVGAALLRGGGRFPRSCKQARRKLATAGAGRVALAACPCSSACQAYRAGPAFLTMGSAASPDGLDCRQLIRRLLAHVAAVEGRGVPVTAMPSASRSSATSSHEDRAAPSQTLLLAVKDLLDRADEKDANRRRKPALNWVEDELADEILSQRGKDPTQYELNIALRQRLEALYIQPTDLEVDVERDAGKASLYSDQGPRAIAIGALAPQVGLSERTLWTGRAHQEPPLATVGGRYISGRVVRQLALEIASTTEPLSRNVALSDFKCFDASTNERMSEAAWKHMRGSMTKPALYSALVKTEATSDSWAGIRDRVQSQLQDAKLVLILATALLTSFWSSRAANFPDPVCQVFGAEMCDQLLEAVHSRKQEWAAIFLLSQMRAGQLTAAESGFSACEIEDLIDDLVTTRVTAEFAQRIDVALSRAEAAGEV